jgi:hypothetical protein
MGFTGGAGHVWQTTNAGASWTDFTGTGSGALPDVPVNAVVVDGVAHIVYVGTDVGVFGSSTTAPVWSELGPSSQSGQEGFLPNAAVTALGLFNAGGRKLLRASTYGRGMWQFDLAAVPDFQLVISDPEQTIFTGQTATFHGSVAALGGYHSAVTLSCVVGATSPPSSCMPSPLILTPGSGTPFTVPTGGTAGDYSFSVQGVGADVNLTTHQAAAVLHIVSFGLTVPSPGTISVKRGSTSAPASFQVIAAGSFDQSVAVTCSSGIAGATCNLTPGGSVSPIASSPVNMTATVAVPLATAAGNYTVTIQATTAGSAPVTTSFALQVTSNPDFILSANTFATMNAGGTSSGGTINVASQDGFAGIVSLTCSLVSGNGSCSASPASVNSFPATVSVTVNAAGLGAGSYQMSVQGVSGATTQTLSIPFNVGDYQITGPSSMNIAPGAQGAAKFTLTASSFYSGKINATCDASAISAATCAVTPGSPITLGAGANISLTATINIPNDAAPGAYTINVHTNDTTGAPTHTAALTLNVIQDYTIGTISPASQTISAGQSAAYNLSILPVGASYSGSVTLKCTVAPVFAGSCSFTPNPVTTSSGNVVMTVIAQGASGQARGRVGLLFYTGWLALLPGIVLLLGLGRRPRRRSLMLCGLLSLLLILPSCAGSSTGGGGGGGGGGGANPGTYTITVTGSPASVSQTAPSTTQLIVQ